MAYVVAAYIAGALSGGAFVVLQRYARIEALKTAFQQELAEINDRSAMESCPAPRTPARRADEPAQAGNDEPAEMPSDPYLGWISIAPAVGQSANQRDCGVAHGG